METKYLIIGAIILILIGVGIYLFSTSSNGLDIFENQEDVGSPPAFPDENGMTAEVIEIFSKSNGELPPDMPE